MTKITLSLSPGRKRLMIINGIVWLFLGNLIAVLVMRLQSGMSIDVVAIYLIFGILGIAPILRATRSQIEFSGNEILFTQPLFKILCNWEDFIGLRISSEGVALRFLREARLAQLTLARRRGARQDGSRQPIDPPLRARARRLP